MIRLSVIPKDPAHLEVISAWLSSVLPDGMEVLETGLLAYADGPTLDDPDVMELLEWLQKDYDLEISREELPDINWNREWESRFEPVVIGDILTIRAEFHEIEPMTRHVITIQPQMSFGTGHHATTWMMVSMMARMDLRGTKVLDAGTGTGILAILAAMWGAEAVTGFDNDEWSHQNALYNQALNTEKSGAAHMVFHNGSLKDVADGDFDVILANINRNYLLEEAAGLVERLASSDRGAYLLISGFYLADCRLVLDAYGRHGLVAQYLLSRDDWACLLLAKPVIR